MQVTEFVEAPDGNSVKLANVLDIAAAPPLRDALIGAMSSDAPFKVDAAAVERISTPCVQVILAAAKAMEQSNREFTLFGPSDAFVTAFDDLGLFPVISTWRIES